MVPRRTRISLQQAFGRTVRELRKELGLSQEEFGFRTDLHRTYVSLLERGLKSPTLNSIERIARALGMKPSEVVGGAEKKTR